LTEGAEEKEEKKNRQRNKEQGRKEVQSKQISKSNAEGRSLVFVDNNSSTLSTPARKRGRGLFFHAARSI
jgi:hypothetical protein